MVAAARLRRAQDKVAQATPYAHKIDELLASLAGSGAHPLLGARPVTRRLIIVLSSDRGLCGSFNAQVLRVAEKEMSAEGTTSIPIGRKALGFFARRNFQVQKTVDGFWANFSYAEASSLARSLTELFLNGDVDQVDVLYNEYVSVITQRPKIVTLLPLAQPSENVGVEVDYIFEPSREALLAALVPRAIETRLYLSCLNSQASEFGARMTAMDSATRNAGEMIDTLTLKMNRARQAIITKELVEIISGAEAQK